MRADRKKRLAARCAAALFMAGILSAGALASGSLTGCGGGGEPSAQAPPDSEGGSREDGSGGALGADSGAAKGRYMEEEIALPEQAANLKFISCLQGDKGQLEFYFQSGDRPRCFVFQAGEWNEREMEIRLPEGINLKAVRAGGDGILYLEGADENYVWHLYAAPDSGELSESYAGIFRVPEGKEYGVIPDYLAILPDGGLLLSQTSEAGVYAPDGSRLFSIAQDYIGMDRRISASAWDGIYLTLLNDQIVRYDTASGETTGKFALPDTGDEKYNMLLFTGEDGGIFMAGRSGLYHTEKDGTVWEQLIDGSLNSMSRQDIFLNHFSQGTEGDYYGLFVKSGETLPLFYRYYYDKTVDTVPPETLTVYALRDNPTVRQAASVMQKNNPQVKVELRIAVEDGEEVTEDVIRALNTELLNGKGADVLILDGLPMESYKNKGILADLGGIAEEMEAGLLPAVTKNFTGEDGEIYYLPARLKLPVIFGEPRAVEALTSLEALAGYEGNPPLLAPNIYENVLRMTARTCYRELFFEDGADKTSGQGVTAGNMREETLRRWLESVKAAGEKSEVKVEFGEEDFERLNISNKVIPDGFGRQSDLRLVKGQCPAAVEMLDSIDSAMLPVSACEMGNYELGGIRGLYIPVAMAGINASTEKMETAGEFIKTLLGREVQDESLRDGFAVRQDSLEKWGMEESEMSVSVGSSNDDFSLSGGWPSEEWRARILGLVKAADTPALVDDSVLKMVVDGSRDYFDGREPVEKAVQDIENQIRLYEAERE